jgi:ABC-type dipeptide/oligopeptide/nickel transport system permease subunit
VVTVVVAVVRKLGKGVAKKVVFGTKKVVVVVFVVVVVAVTVSVVVSVKSGSFIRPSRSV